MRILIVEDEMVSRTKMETIMRSFGDCTTTESGSQAVFLFDQALKAGTPYHLITLDINMPDMQGTKVLQIIRELEGQQGISDGQRVRIMMVTGQMDKEKVLSCIEWGCDDYLAKPFNVQMIRKKLQRLCIGFNDTSVRETATPQYRKLTAEAILRDINNALRKGEISLPVVPQIGLEFRRRLQANAELHELVALLKRDMVIASKLVRMANSAMYRGFGAVRTIEQAISRLGLSATEQMVNALSNQRLYAIDTARYRSLLDRLWKHALASALAADSLSKLITSKLLVDPFTAGLLHDIGALALIQIIAEMEKRGRFEQAIEMDALFDTIFSYHASFGAKLLEKWRFEFDYVHIALYHSSLHTADSITQDLLVASLANQVAKSLGFSIVDQSQIDNLGDTPAAQQLNINDVQLQTVQFTVLQRLGEAEEAVAS